MSFLDLYQGDQAQAAGMQPNEGTRLPSGFDENFHAAWSDGLLFSQSIARQNARAAVLSDYAGEVRQKTGYDINSEQVSSGPEAGLDMDFERINARVAKMKESYPDLDLNPLSDDEIEKRAVEKSQTSHRAYETLQSGERTWGGWFGSQMGNLAAGALDPINIVGLGVAPEAAGIGVLSTALRWGALAGVSQAAIEAASDTFKEQVQPGYMESGQPLKEIAGAFVGGAVVGGGVKALGNAWTRVKTGQWPTSVRDAGNVIESHTNVADTNPFPGAEGEIAHHEALVKTIDDILAGRPVQIDGIITPEFLERSRMMVQSLQTNEPMRLPVINQRAIELVAEQDKLARRDAELASSLETMPQGDISAADRLNRLQAVDHQIAATEDLAEKRKLGERRDQILIDTNPEALQAAAAPIEARRQAEAERASIAGRLEDITAEHAKLQAGSLPPMELPALGQSERIPTGPKGQFEMDLQPAAEEPVAEGQSMRGRERSHRREDEAPQPPLQTTDEMTKTLAAPDHQEAIRADIDRERALGDVQVPGLDEQGNHTMVSVDKAMDEVDAYKAAAEQIQACANPIEEAAE